MASEGERKDMVNVLIVALAAQGHMNPMLTLAKHLISQGLTVTLATTEASRDNLLNSSTAAGIRLEFFSDGLSLDFDRKNSLDHFMECMSKYGPINLSALIKSLSKISVTRFSCIIINPFMPWVADVAAEHGIPCAMLWIQSCMLYSIYCRFYNNLNLFPTSNTPSLSVELPGLPLLETQDLPSFILPSNTRGKFSELLSKLFQNMNLIKWVLGNTFIELEKNVIESMENIHSIKPIGPLILKDQNQTLQIEDKCIQWLNLQKPNSVIYISFGTMIELSKNEIKIIAKTLKKNGFKFLWVLKVDFEEMLPLGFIQETKEQGLIVKWCPQVQVLEHSSISCFLTHCGWNSLIESITAGVPVIGYPQWTDQPTNAKLITNSKIGVRLKRDEDGALSSEELEKCMQEIMGGEIWEEYKKNVLGLRLAARTAVADGGSSDRNIQWFINEISGTP